MGFKKLQSNSRKIIEEWFNRYLSDRIWKEFNQGWVFVENEVHTNSSEIQRMNRELYDFISHMEKRYKQIVAGVHIGNIKDFQFRITLGGALAIGNLETSNKVKLTEKGEKRFLYGRDLHEQDLVERKIEPDLLGKVVVICNRKGNVLGMGEYQPKMGSPKSQYSRVIRQIVDRGWFLRSGI